MKPRLVLIGGGGHCKACIDVIEQEGRFEIAGIVDVKDKVGQNVLNYKVIGSDENLIFLIKEYEYFLITIGQIKSPVKRIEKFNQLNALNAKMPVIISPRAYVSKYAAIDAGSIVMHNAFVNAGTHVGKNCIINTGAIIEHDAIIGDNCHISTGAIVNGGVRIEDGVFFGSGAVSKEYIRIIKNSFIKANSLVKDLNE